MILRYVLLLTATLLSSASFAEFFDSPSDRFSGNVPVRMQTWLACFSNPTSQECRSCQMQDDPTRDLSQVIAHVSNSCIPGPRDREVVFSSFLRDQTQILQRDHYICECLREERGNDLEKSSYRSGATGPQRAREIQAAAASALNRIYQTELTDRLRTQRVQSTFSAMSYIDVTADAFSLANKYDEVNARSANQSTPSSTEAVHIERQQQYAAIANDEDITRIFNTEEMPANFCVPYRNFVAHKQFPESESFYNGLSGMSSFISEDWDYRNIMGVLEGAFFRDQGRERALANPRMASRYERAQFLYDNPVLRNIFLSPNADVKGRLFNIVKSMPRPECSNGVCQRNENWSRQMDEYRRRMAEFLALPEVISANEAGGVVASGLDYDAVGELARVRSKAADSVIPAAQIGDAGQWRGYCDSRRGLLENNTASLRAQIESEFGERNFRNIESDGEFQRMNTEVCSTVRKNPETNVQDSFFTYLQRECPATSTEQRCSIEARGALLGQFLTDYSDSQGNPDTSAKLLIPFLTGRAAGPQIITRNDTQNFKRATSDPAIEREPVRFTSREYASISPEASTLVQNGSVSRGPASTTSVSSSAVSSAAQATSSNGSQFTSLNQMDQLIIPSQPGSSASVPAQTPEVIRSAISQNETDSREIREEISSLRNVIGRDPSSGGPQDNRAFTSLNDRLAALESRLTAKERENETLREQLAEAEEVNVRSPQRTQAIASDDNSRRNSEGGTVQQQSVASTPQGGASGGTISAPNPSGGQASLNNSASVPVPRSVSGSNSALLSKYGVRESTVQDGITVASSSSTIDYQQLRSQSENSILPLSVSVEEFNQIAGNNQAALSRYFEQVRAMPGEVVRLNLTSGDNRSMEIYVVKSGNEFSIVQGPQAGRSIASEALVPSPQESREFLLDNLRRELTN